MSNIVVATVHFHIPVDNLPPDIPGTPETPETDAELPMTGAEIVASDFVAKIMQTLPTGVYPILADTTHFKAERQPF